MNIIYCRKKVLETYNKKPCTETPYNLQMFVCAQNYIELFPGRGVVCTLRKCTFTPLDSEVIVILVRNSVDNKASLFSCRFCILFQFDKR